MAMRLWRIEEIEARLDQAGCSPVSGWDDRVCGRWWSRPDGKWFLVPFPEEPDQEGNTANPLECRYPDYIVDDIFRVLRLDV